jgi:hypothetical protein
VFKYQPVPSSFEKYPLTSMTRSVVLRAYTLIAPLFPLGIIAPFATTVPSIALRVDTKGWSWPVGHTVIYAKYPGGTAVKLRTKAVALEGTPQAD